MGAEMKKILLSLLGFCFVVSTSNAGCNEYALYGESQMPTYEICSPNGQCEVAKLEVECGNIYSTFLEFSNGMRWNHTSKLSGSGASMTIERKVTDNNSGKIRYTTICAGSPSECSGWGYREIPLGME